MLTEHHYRDLVRRTTERHLQIWWENLTKRGCSNNPGVDGTRVLKCNLNDQDTKPWTRFPQIRIEISDGLVSKRSWTFGFYTMRGISRLAENLLASQEVFRSTGLISSFVACQLDWLLQQSIVYDSWGMKTNKGATLAAETFKETIKLRFQVFLV